MSELTDLYRIKEITDRFSDEKSLDVFNARIEYMINRNFYDFWKRIKQITEHGWKLNESDFSDDEYIVFTAGVFGRQCADMLRSCSKKPLFFVDNNSDKQGKNVDGLQIKSVECVKDYPNIKIISGNVVYAESLKKQLKEIGASNGVIDGACAFSGWQYFDVFEPDSNEVFVDAGAYDGGTSFDFVNWCGEKGYDKIYSFEPDTSKKEKIESFFAEKQFKNATLIPKGTWSEETELLFENIGSSGAGFVQEESKTCIKVPVIDIDTVLKGEKVTYIKMDVEGSESETLYGARESIRKWKPKLAVCVYHKPFDIIKLPLQIIDLNPDYKFSLRHYASNLCETVLYAE